MRKVQLTLRLVVAMLLLLASQVALGCSCRPFAGESLEARMAVALNQFDNVFLGYSQSVSRELESSPYSPVIETVRFYIAKSWKLQSAAEIVETASDVTGGLCGRSIEPGTLYLVFTSSYEGLPQNVSICSPTEFFESANDKIEMLNRLTTQCGAQVRPLPADTWSGHRLPIAWSTFYCPETSIAFHDLRVIPNKANTDKLHADTRKASIP